MEIVSRWEEADTQLATMWWLSTLGGHYVHAPLVRAGEKLARDQTRPSSAPANPYLAYAERSPSVPS